MVTYTDYIELGPTPAEEDCTQVGDPSYWEKAHDECSRYIELIRNKLGSEPQGAKLDVKGFNHDFGTYYEVVVRYDHRVKEAVDYAFRCDLEAPSRWTS